MRSKGTNEIRTPREKIKMGERGMLDSKPVMVIKNGPKKDVVTLEYVAEALYGPGTKCVVFPPEGT